VPAAVAGPQKNSGTSGRDLPNAARNRHTFGGVFLTFWVFWGRINYYPKIEQTCPKAAQK